MASGGVNIQAEIGAAISSFRLEQAGIETLLRGPVMQDLVKRAIRVEAAAKQNATDRPGPRVRTGRLRGSITWRAGVDPADPYVDIGSAVVYAPYVELGTSRMPAFPYLRPALEAARTT